MYEVTVSGSVHPMHRLLRMALVCTVSLRSWVDVTGLVKGHGYTW